jgi:hypothetical protein
VTWDYLNAQEQRKMVWPPSFALARAYLDQLERSSGLAAARIAAIRAQLAAAEKQSGSQRRASLTQLASELRGDAGSSGDQARVRLLAGAVAELAGAQR